MSEPPHGTEVFVGGIPRTASEEQLKVFAEAVGEVHAVVLLKDPQNNEQNRGCATAQCKHIPVDNVRHPFSRTGGW
jgi:hypothetical protein